MNRHLRLGLAAAALGFGALFAVSSRTWYGLAFFSAVLPAWAFVGAGLVAWSRRPRNRMGRLMVLTGFLLFAGTLMATRVPPLWTLGAALLDAGSAVLVYAVLAYPVGYLTTWTARALFGFTVVAMVFFARIGIFWWDPRDDGCTDCQAGLNLLKFGDHPPDFVPWAWEYLIPPSYVAIFALLSIVIVRRWAVATKPARRVLWPVYVPVLAFSLEGVQGIVVYHYLSGAGAYGELYAKWAPYLVPAEATLIPLTFLFGLLRARARRYKVGELVVELGRVPTHERLRDAVARTLGDSSVEVGFWSEQAGRYLTSEGHALELPDDGARTTTYLKQRGQPLAAIVHDPALLDDPAMVDAVGAATRLAVENERLQAEVRAQLEEVRASRTRIVAASDAERQRIERNLHDGAQQRLLALSLELAMIEDRLDSGGDPELRGMVARAEAELAAAQAELRTLAHGLHPAILSDQGLAPALADAAERAPLPVEVSAPDTRYPAQVEAAAYFVASEALTNVARYARASHATVRVQQSNGRLDVEVVDDGIGGADPRRGSGLRGLADRVAALDGTLTVDSEEGRGTRVVARIPCG